MQRIPIFDPTAALSGQFDLFLPNGGWLVVTNESVIAILLQFGDGQQRLINPFTIRAMQVSVKQTVCQWTQDYSITGAQAPTGLNITTGECYDPAEWTGGEFILALPRLVNIGNTTSGGTVSDLVNDGNAPGTQIIESTASGAPGSNVKVTNDGGMLVKVLDNGAYSTILSITPGTVSTPQVSFFNGGSSFADQVPATGVLAGALPAGVTLPGSQVTGAVASATAAGSASSVPAAGVAAGALPAGVTTNGAVIVGVGAHDSGGAPITTSQGTVVPGTLNENELFFLHA